MKKPSILLSLVPMIVLVTFIVIGSILFGDELTSGPSQIALLGGALTGAIIAMWRLGISWEKIEEGISDNFSKSGGVFFILLSIGALTSSWMLSGVVPTLIYYGLKLINPSIFLLVIFVFTALSIAIPMVPIVVQELPAITDIIPVNTNITNKNTDGCITFNP